MAGITRAEIARLDACANGDHAERYVRATTVDGASWNILYSCACQEVHHLERDQDHAAIAVARIRAEQS